MRLRDLELNEYVDAFGKMTEPYFIQYMKDKDEDVDWLDKMRWTKYNASFKQLVSDGVITGKEADSKYWIRKFREDNANIEEFMKFVREKEKSKK